MPCNQDVEHPTNSSFDRSDFITDSYFRSIEFGLEFSKASPEIFDSFFVGGHSAEL